ncbi:uncharacterized protein LOC124814478 [Hydra vulgaris]|uniref:uncharacterized protein LOC124814478 n=1 Tax=Hydra vulgaris TaxID=6087 RepID=UPI001F5FB4D3|nr:uncharacterized protein LOC124814478 [Hydra vulgaris]
MQYKKSTRIDVELQKENEKSCKYWTEVLKRVVVVIKFLAERGLAFRGDNQLHNSPNNGNYLGCIYLLAEFDPFLKEHIQRYGNPGKGNVSYLSANICNEFINILVDKVLKQIIRERMLNIMELASIQPLILVILSETRWSSRSDATRAFYANYLQIRQVLCEVTSSKHQPPPAAHEAKSLNNIVNKALHEPGIELSIIIKLCDKQYFHDTRIKFETFEGQAKDLTESDYKEATQRKPIRKRFDDEVMDTSNPSLNVSASDNFRIQQYYVIIDRLNSEMEKLRAAYKVLYERFNFLLDNRSLSSEEVVAKTKALIQLYPSDLEDEFTDEFFLFLKFLVMGKLKGYNNSIDKRVKE